MSRIIHRTTTGYELEHFSDSDPEVFRAFGTWVLPLPFTAQADPGKVLEDQKARTTQDVYLCECAMVPLTPETIADAVKRADSHITQTGHVIEIGE